MIQFNGNNHHDVLHFCHGRKPIGNIEPQHSHKATVEVVIDSVLLHTFEGLILNGLILKPGISFWEEGGKLLCGVPDPDWTLADHKWSDEDITFVCAPTKTVTLALDGVDGTPEFEINEEDFMAIGKHMGYFS